MTRRRSSTRESGGGRVVVLIVLWSWRCCSAAAYAAAYAVAGDKVPRGTTVAGVDDRRSHAGRRRGRALRAGGSPTRVDEPITVPSSGRTLTVDPAEAGLGGRLRGLGRRGRRRPQLGARRWLWDYYTGGDDARPRRDVDETAMDAALDALAESVGTPPATARSRSRGDRIVRVDRARPAGRSTRDADPRGAHGGVPRRRRRPPSSRWSPAEPDIDARRRRRRGRRVREPGRVRPGHAGLRHEPGPAPARATSPPRWR